MTHNKKSIQCCNVPLNNAAQNTDPGFIGKFGWFTFDPSATYFYLETISRNIASLQVENI